MKNINISNSTILGFLSKTGRTFMLGLTLFVLSVGVYSAAKGDLLHRGPSVVIADGENEDAENESHESENEGCDCGDKDEDPHNDDTGGEKEDKDKKKKTPKPTSTPTPRPSKTPYPTHTPTPKPSKTPYPTPYPPTPTPTPTPTPFPSRTPYPTPYPSHSSTPTPTPTPTPKPSKTPLPSMDCPIGKHAEIVNGIIICVIQNQTNNPIQNNNQTTNVNPVITQNTTVTGGNSNARSDSDSNASVNVTINNPEREVEVIREVAGVTTIQTEPQVVMQTKGDVKELPKTGLPLLGWALASLLPAGAGLKRFGKKQDETSANSIWTEKQLSN